MAITSPGIFQSGIGVEHRLDRHLRLHAADEGLADVDLHFQRIHVDDRADAGAGEAAAGRQRRDDLARLRGLGDHHAGERRAHDGVVDADASAMRRLVAGDLRVALRGGQLRAQRIALGDGLVELRPSTTSCCCTSSAQARERWLRLRASCACTLPIWLVRGARPATRRGRAARRRRRDRASPAPGRPRRAGLPRSAPRAPCR